MADLDQVLASPPPSPGDRQIVEGALVVKAGKRYARVDGSSALWGPVIGGAALNDGATVVLAITQDGRPFVIYPQS